MTPRLNQNGVAGNRIQRDVTPLDINSLADALERRGAIASAAMLRTVWDERCEFERRARAKRPFLRRIFNWKAQ